MTRKSGSDWAFRTMSLIHDNPLRRKFSNPYKTLESAGLKAGQKVLEIGCGPGFFTIPAAKIVTETGKVYALDIHPLAMKKVQEKLEKNKKITNVEKIPANATDTGIPDQSIDLTFLFGLPRLIRNNNLFNDLLDELYRVLRPEGIMSIKSSNKNLIKIVEQRNFSFLENKDGIYLFKKSQ